MHVRAGVWEDADAPPKRRPSVQVEGQLMELCWLAADSKHLVGSWDGSQVVDPQEVSRLTRQEQLNTSVKPRPLCFRPLLELYPACHTDGPSPAAASQVRDKLLPGQGSGGPADGDQDGSEPGLSAAPQRSILIRAQVSLLALPLRNSVSGRAEQQEQQETDGGHLHPFNVQLLRESTSAAPQPPTTF